MRIFKKVIALLALSAFVIFCFQSCKKYPDGPMLSLRSKTERVANTWKIDNYKVNEVDYTSLLTDYSETFTKEGAYSYQWEFIDGSGTWAFQNDNMEIKINGTDNQSSHTLFILKLEEKQFWYYYMDGTDRKELHMIQK
jgi:hypothetical protein